MPNDELNFALVECPLFDDEKINLSFDCLLSGCGFDKWEGIVILTQHRIIFSSAPGVFSSGKVIPIAWSDVKSADATSDNICAAFEYGLERSAIDCTPLVTTDAEIWPEAALQIIIYGNSILAPGECMLNEPLHELFPEQAAHGIEFMEKLVKCNGTHSPALRWYAFLLLASDDPKSIPKLRKLDRASYDNYISLLHAFSLMLASKYESAEYELLGIERSRDDEVYRRACNLCRMLSGKKSGVSLEQPGLKSPSMLRTGAARVEIMEVFGVFQLLNFITYIGLFRLLKGSRALLTDIWSAFYGSNLDNFISLLDTYRKTPEAEPEEIIRAEALMEYVSGNDERSLNLIMATRSGGFLKTMLRFSLYAANASIALEIERLAANTELMDSEKLYHTRILLREGKPLKALNLLSVMPRLPGSLGYFARLTEAECLMKLGEREKCRDKLFAASGADSLALRFPEIFFCEAFGYLFPLEILLRAEFRMSLKNFDEIFPELPMFQELIAHLPGNGYEKSSESIMREAHSGLIGRDVSERLKLLPEDIAKCFSASVNNSNWLIVERPDLRKKCIDLLDHSAKPLIIGVMGEFNAGKSTFLNALLGEKVLPTGVVPTTRIPCILRWGEIPYALIHGADQTKSMVELHSISDYLGELGSGDIRDDRVVRMEVFYPAPVLKNRWFIDSPGLNSLYFTHQQISESEMESFDAVIWLTDATQAGEASEISMLSRLIKPWQKVIHVLNRIDEIEYSEREEVISYYRSFITDDSRPVFVMSALETLQARKNSSGDSQIKNLISDIEAAIDAMNGNIAKKSSFEIRLRSLLDDAFVEIREEITLLDESLRTVNEVLESLLAFENSIERSNIIEDAARKHLSDTSFESSSDNTAILICSGALEDFAGSVLMSVSKLCLKETEKIAFPSEAARLSYFLPPDLAESHRLYLDAVVNKKKQSLSHFILIRLLSENFRCRQTRMKAFHKCIPELRTELSDSCKEILCVSMTYINNLKLILSSVKSWLLSI